MDDKKTGHAITDMPIVANIHGPLPHRIAHLLGKDIDL
jgi:hypothetical protein